MQIPRIYTPDNSGNNPSVNPDRPVNKIAIGYQPPTGQIVTVSKQLAVMINGVDVVSLLDGRMPTPDLSNLGHPLWRGQYLISVAQTVTHDILGVAADFATGESFDARASWNGALPLTSKPYREHGWGFMQADDYVGKYMDPLWSTHEDAGAIRQFVGALMDSANRQTLKMITTRDSSYVKYIEPVDRIDGVVVEMAGAVSAAASPYFDIEALYQVAENSRAYLFGYDYIVNNSGRVVFHCADAPGRVAGASVEMVQGLQPERPDAALFTNPAAISMQTIPVAVFAGQVNGTLAGFDYFLTPPRAVDDAGYPLVEDGSSYVGRVVASVPKTGEFFTLYDPSLNPNQFSGTVTLAAPISFSESDFIQVFQVRPGYFIDPQTSVKTVDVNPSIELKLWLNRRVTLLGPHAHLASNRLNYMWSRIVGGQQSSLRLQDKLRVLAAMKTRTEKSLGSFATYTEALLGLPLSPFDGAYVMNVIEPDPRGYVNGQIDVYGAVQEYDGDPVLAVAVGDKVTLLQSLLNSSADGATITDIYNDSNFLLFSPNGTAPAGQPGDLDYVRSKIVGSVQLPADFVAQYPTGTVDFFASQLLRWTSFRINLGTFASRRLLANTDLIPVIFSAIDATKPSGRDYYLRLADGRVITRPTSAREFIDISSNLNLPTDHAFRIFNDDNFAANQYKNFYISVNYGANPIVGDEYLATVVDAFGPTTYQFLETLLESDFVQFPLFPLDGPLSRIVAAINGTPALAAVMTATLIENKIQLKVLQTAAAQQAVKCTAALTAYMTQINGVGVVSFNPSSGSPVEDMAVAGYDISRVWTGTPDALSTLDAYVELTPTASAPPPAVADIADYGAGPYDPTFLPVSFGAPLTVSFAMPAPYPETGWKAGRLVLEGYAASSGADTGNVILGFDLFNSFSIGDTLLVTVSGGYFATPITVSRVMLADDETPGCVFLGLGRAIETDPTLQQFFRCFYVTDGTKKKLSILPHNVDDYAVLNTVVFTVTVLNTGVPWGVAPTFTLTNAAGSTTSAAPIFISPAQSPAPDLVASFVGLPLLSCPVTILKRIHSADETGAANYFRYEWRGFPVTFPNSTIGITLTIPSATPRTISIFNCRAIINDYPEYSRDDNAMTMDAVIRVEERLGTFTDGLGVNNPPIEVVENLHIYYTEKFDGTTDVTPRMVSPSQTLVSSEIVDFRWQEVYLSGAVALRTVKQNKNPGNVPVTISYIAGSPILYLDTNGVTGNGPYVLLVLGTDYTETTSTTITLINTLAHPALTTSRVVGFVESGLYDYYLEGPGRSTLERTNWLNSAPGVRALYDELGAITTAEKNRFRQVNADNLGPDGGAPIASPYNVSDYLVSGVKDNPSFGADGSSVQIIDSIEFEDES